MFRTTHVRAVVAELLKTPDAEHYGGELKTALDLNTSVVYGILSRLTDHGYLTDLGMRPSETGGSPRHAYRVADIEGLRTLLSL
jgi:DNA-binding PadR family transcriptional regulator